MTITKMNENMLNIAVKEIEKKIRRANKKWTPKEYLKNRKIKSATFTDKKIAITMEAEWCGQPGFEYNKFEFDLDFYGENATPERIAFEAKHCYA